MNILVTGGCGYKGHVLVPKLLGEGHKVTVIDTMWFGNFFDPNDNLKVIQQSVLSIDDIDVSSTDAVIHLASIANDPCGDLNPKLTWEVSALATMRLIDKCVRHGVGRFIYASSGSVYGIKDEEFVTEDLELIPLTEYNKTKMVAERTILSYADQINVQIVRPATVCGLSPRMRLDVSVNMLTMQALENNKITVFGGQQTRPNIHIDDITDIYIFLLRNPQITGIFNAGFENISILDIAERIRELTNAEIVVTESNDPRSYRLDSSKLLATGYTPHKTVAHAIDEIITSYNDGSFRNDPSFHNLSWMQANEFWKT